MEPELQIVFGPFRFDRTTQSLWQGPREIPLRARTLAVLHYLLEHPGRVIARQEFAQHVWPGTHVTPSVLRVCIWELRQALGESGGTPHYIETVGQQGYRFRATRRIDKRFASGPRPPGTLPHRDLEVCFLPMQPIKVGATRLEVIGTRSSERNPA